MVTMEYNRVKISVPENWNDINLGFYEEISNKKPETRREQVDLVAQICKTSPEILLNWPAEIFSDIVDRIDFIFKGDLAVPSPEVVIDKVRYIVPIEDELTLGAWVDVDEVQKKGEKVLSNILAIVCRPAGEEYNHKNNEVRAAMFAAQPVSKVLGVFAFFLHCKTVSEQRTAAYTNLAQTIGQLPMSIKPFLKRGGGIKLSTIWLTVKYYSMILLLHYQLQKFLRTCNIKKTKITQKKPSVN